MIKTQILENHLELESKLALIDQYCKLHKHISLQFIYDKIMLMSDYELIQLTDALLRKRKFYVVEGGKK